MLNNPLKLVGYVRVSTEDQKAKGSSLDAQREKITNFVDQLGHTLFEVVDDGGECARTLDRPGIQRALGLLRTLEVDGLVVANLDRLSRHVGDVVGLVEGYFLEPQGSVLLSASEPIETRTAVGRLQIYILATVSQYQREAGAERTAGVMGRKRREAERTGNLAFGTKLDESNPKRSRSDQPIALVDSPEDRAIEAIILALRCSGKTYQAIADQLNADGVRAKRGITKRSTGLWAKSSIHRICQRANLGRRAIDGGEA